MNAATPNTTTATIAYTTNTSPVLNTIVFLPLARYPDDFVRFYIIQPVIWQVAGPKYITHYPKGQAQNIKILLAIQP